MQVLYCRTVRFQCRRKNLGEMKVHRVYILLNRTSSQLIKFESFVSEYLDGLILLRVNIVYCQSRYHSRTHITDNSSSDIRSYTTRVYPYVHFDRCAKSTQRILKITAISRRLVKLKNLFAVHVSI